MASLQTSKYPYRRPAGPPATAGQARLNPDSMVSDAAWRSFRKWQAAFKDEGTYASYWLRVRAVELVTLIGQQDQAFREMPNETPGAEYLTAHEQLQRLKGQQWAIADVLKAREGRQGHVSAAELDGCGCGRGLKPNTSRMDLWEVLGDPFISE